MGNVQHNLYRKIVHVSTGNQKLEGINHTVERLMTPTADKCSWPIKVGIVTRGKIDREPSSQTCKSVDS